jgi:hypothetical protein
MRGAVLLAGALVTVCLSGLGCIHTRFYTVHPSPIEVEVLDGETGKPILGALVGVAYEDHPGVKGEYIVLANPPKDTWVTTDRQGKVTLRGITTGTWSVGCAGYHPVNPVFTKDEAAVRKITVRLYRLNARQGTGVEQSAQTGLGSP